MADPRSERQLALETQAAARMREVLLTITEDGQTIADSIEGETSLHEAIRRVYWNVIEDQILTDGLKETITTLEGRKSRIDARIERYRTAIQKGMEAGELTKLEMPEATLSLRNNEPKVEVYDEAAIPPEFFDPQPPKLNKSRLKDAMTANDVFPKTDPAVPGARFSNGGQSLSVRRA